MSTLRTHRDYVQALAYAKDREQVHFHLESFVFESILIFSFSFTSYEPHFGIEYQPKGGECRTRQSHLFMGCKYVNRPHGQQQYSDKWVKMLLSKDNEETDYLIFIHFFTNCIFVMK